jgi:hypothetical protein
MSALRRQLPLPDILHLEPSLERRETSVSTLNTAHDAVHDVRPMRVLSDTVERLSYHYGIRPIQLVQ